MVLIGFASSGKTAAGKLAAEKLNYSFIDLDDKIEEVNFNESGVRLSCREIYSRYGLKRFLELENRALLGLSGVKNTVLATGGGAPIQEQNRTILKQMGILIYLYATPETLLTRMKNKGLPAYLQANPAQIHAYWQERHTIYTAIADFTIDTTDKDIEDVAKEVVNYHG